MRFYNKMSSSGSGSIMTTTVAVTTTIFLFLSLLVDNVQAGCPKVKDKPCNGGNETTWGSDDGRRTLLTTSSTMNDEEWLEYKENCNSYMYDLYGVVDRHMFLVAQPKEDAIEAGCEEVYFHSSEDKDGTGTNIKFVAIKHDHDEVTEEALEGGLWKFGASSFQFVELSSAFDVADANAPGKVKYNIAFNNCGDFGKNFLMELGQGVDKEFTNFVVNNLLDAYGNDVITEIRNNEENSSWLMRRLSHTIGWSNERLAHYLVEARVSELYDIN